MQELVEHIRIAVCLQNFWRRMHSFTLALQVQNIVTQIVFLVSTSGVEGSIIGEESKIALVVKLTFMRVKELSNGKNFFCRQIRGCSGNLQDLGQKIDPIHPNSSYGTEI